MIVGNTNAKIQYIQLTMYDWNIQGLLNTLDTEMHK